MAISAPARSMRSAKRWWPRRRSGPVTREIVLGVLSLIVWALIVVVTLKYVAVLLRCRQQRRGRHALAHGAGVPRARPALADGPDARRDRRRDVLRRSSLITPAISVLSAVEGLKLVTPAFEPYVLPLTIVILVALFAVQSRGTGEGRGLVRPDHGGLVRRDRGRRRSAHRATIRACLRRSIRSTRSPSSSSHGTIGLVTLGAVFLAVTGGEALYADLGHFGRKPIQTAWFCLVLPALLINYFGQGALVLAHPAAIENPFYRLVPDMLLLPMVVLATVATVIASQAVITGAYSHHAPGDPARAAAALRDPPHLGGPLRPDLHAAREHRCCSSACCCWSGCSARRAIWPAPTARGGRDQPWWSTAPGFHRDLEAVAMAALVGAAAGQPVRHHRRHVPVAPTC